MNLMQLKYFMAICQHGTVSDAAEYLHIAQPSLSAAIKELEGEFGVTLFKRHHRGMQLTEEGECLQGMAKDLLEKAERIENVMKDMGMARKKLRLGVPPMISSLILPCVYRDFLKDNPDLNLEVIEGGRHELLKKLDEDSLDMVFLPHNQSFGNKLSVIKAAKLEITCCTSKEAPLTFKDGMTPEELKDIPIVLFEDGFFQAQEIKRWFSASGVTPNILFQTGQLSTMLSAISNKIAIGFMFRDIIEKNTELKAVSLAEPLYIDVSLVWRKDAYSFSGMRKFREYMHDSNPFMN